MDEKQLLINELEKYVGNCDSTYFKYLAYCGNLSDSEALRVVESIKENIHDNTLTKIDEIYPLLTFRFNAKNKVMLGEAKVRYLNNMIKNNSLPYSNIKKQYHLNQREQDEVLIRLTREIRQEGLNEFEINQRLEKYFQIVVKQRKYKAQLTRLSKQNYENEFTEDILEITQNLDLEGDIVPIFNDIKQKIDDGYEFDENIGETIKIEAYKLSNLKKEQTRDKLNAFILHKTDTLEEIFKRNNIDANKSEEILRQLNLDITSGLIRENEITEEFIESRCK